MSEPPTPAPKKEPRLMVSVRTSPAGDAAMRKIAKAKGIRISDARRDAFALYVQQNKEHLG